MIHKLSLVSRVMILSALALICALLAYVSVQSDRAPLALVKEERLLPGLMGKINDITKIELARKEGSFCEDVRRSAASPADAVRR